MTFDPKQTRAFHPPGAPLVVTIRARMGDPETGGWCDTCFLPSVVTVPYRLVTDGGSVLKAGKWFRCEECGAQGEAK